MSKYENVPFSKLLGTVVTERVFDMIMLLLLTLVVVVSQFKQVGIFLDNNEEIKQSYTRCFIPMDLRGVGSIDRGGGRFLLVCTERYFLHPVTSFLSGMKEGLLTVKDVKHKWLFIGHTIFIWLMYFLMLYVCFFCFQFTSHLGTDGWFDRVCSFPVTGWWLRCRVAWVRGISW